MTHDLTISANMNTSHRLVLLCSMVDTFPAFAKFITSGQVGAFRGKTRLSGVFWIENCHQPKGAANFRLRGSVKARCWTREIPEGADESPPVTVTRVGTGRKRRVFEPALLWICSRWVKVWCLKTVVHGFWLYMLKTRSRRVFAQCNHVIYWMTCRRSKQDVSI